MSTVPTVARRNTVAPGFAIDTTVYTPFSHPVSNPVIVISLPIVISPLGYVQIPLFKLGTGTWFLPSQYAPCWIVAVRAVFTVKVLIAVVIPTAGFSTEASAVTSQTKVTSKSGSALISVNASALTCASQRC